MQPSARALTALSLLAALGSLTAAASRLGVTRSALSHRIAGLEDRLGVTLVRKSGRHLSLTEDGEKLLAGMGDALERIEAAVSIEREADPFCAAPDRVATTRQAIGLNDQREGLRQADWTGNIHTRTGG
jgi:DNA-binding transcriptional LysR family regulator